MKQKNRWTGWLAVALVTLLMLALAGCGGGSSSATPTKSTTAGSVTAVGGNSGASALTVAAPAGVSMTIPANTNLTDGSGNPVSGTITTTVSYSPIVDDLPAAARTLPAGATLAAFADVDLTGSTTQVKNFSNPVALGIQVPPAIAAVGDTVAIYSFNGGTGQWSFERIEKVDANRTVTPGVTHLSIWGVFKSSVTPPVKPAGFSVAGGDASAILTWNTAADASYYNVYYSKTAGVTPANGTRIDHATSGGMTVTGLENGTPYYFIVTAVNPGGESLPNEKPPVTPAATVQPPGNTTGVGLTSPEAGQARVTWTTPVANATSYNVYYLQATSQPTNAQVLAGSVQSSTTSPAVISGLTSGATYYFLVRAANSAGEGNTQNSAKFLTIL